MKTSWNCVSCFILSVSLCGFMRYHSARGAIFNTKISFKKEITRLWICLHASDEPLINRKSKRRTSEWIKEKLTVGNLFFFLFVFLNCCFIHCIVLDLSFVCLKSAMTAHFYNVLLEFGLCLPGFYFHLISNPSLFLYISSVLPPSLPISVISATFWAGQ